MLAIEPGPYHSFPHRSSHLLAMTLKYRLSCNGTLCAKDSHSLAYQDEHGFGGILNGVRALALSLTGCVPLGRLLSLLETQFPHL